LKLLTKGTGVFDRTINILAFVACVLIIFTMLIVCTDVVMRYFLRRPIIWVIEITEYLLLYITFLSAAWVLKREGHVKVDVFVNQLNPRAQTVFGIVTSTVGVIICLGLVWYGVQVTWDHILRHVMAAESLIKVPYAPILAIIPIGSFLLMLQFLRRAYGYLGSWRASVNKEQRS